MIINQKSLICISVLFLAVSPLSISAETRNSIHDVSETSAEKDKDKALREALSDAELETYLYIGRTGGHRGVAQAELTNSPTRKEVIRLIQKGADLTIADENGYPRVVTSGIKLGWIEIVTHALDAGVDVNEKHIGGNALFWVISVGDNAEMAELFVKRGIDLSNKGTRTKAGALAEACLRGRYNIVKLLLESDADTEMQNDQGWTPVMWAAQAGNLEIIKLLDDHDANLNHVDDSGNGTLHATVGNGNLDVFLYLLKQDVDPYKTNHRGVSVLAKAKRSLHHWKKSLREMPGTESFTLKVKNLQKIIEILEDLEENREPQD